MHLSYLWRQTLVNSFNVCYKVCYRNVKVRKWFYNGPVLGKINFARHTFNM